MIYFRACVLFVVYVIIGVIYNAVRNKAGGSGLFTHVLIISACPGLVKVFTIQDPFYSSEFAS